MPEDKTVIYSLEDKKRSVNLSPYACAQCGETMHRDPVRGGMLKCPRCGAVRCLEIHSFQPGLQVGKYRLLQTIGQGGMGALFLCCPVDDLSVRYALKIQMLGNSPDMELLNRRFERESILLSHLKHDCIVRVYDRWHDEDGVYILMEYIDGKNLSQLKEEGFEFTEEIVLQIAWIISDALRYAWDELKLIHRDIKPSNIMIDRENNVRLLDFGIAKTLDPQQIRTELTQMGSGLGTPGYMSPEQFRDAGTVNCTSDIFSLGCTLYYLLAGHPPFPGKSAMAVFNRMLEEEAPPIRKINPSVSAPCEKLLSDMLEKDPACRPFSWRKLMVDIEKVLNGTMPLVN